MDPEDEPDNEELREAILSYVGQIQDANQDQICMDTEPIKNTGARTVGSQLKNCSHVTGLMLSGCQITDNGAIALFKGAIDCPNIQQIDLSKNTLTYKVFPALINLLNAKPDLHTVKIGPCDIENEDQFNMINPYTDRVDF